MEKYFIFWQDVHDFGKITLKTALVLLLLLFTPIDKFCNDLFDASFILFECSENIR